MINQLNPKRNTQLMEVAPVRISLKMVMSGISLSTSTMTELNMCAAAHTS